jgi:hypothetical protein
LQRRNWRGTSNRFRMMAQAGQGGADWVAVWVDQSSPLGRHFA